MIIKEIRTKPMPCDCSNVFQEQRYGRGMRIHNKTFHNKSNRPKGWRCTVCGSHKVDK